MKELEVGDLCRYCSGCGRLESKEGKIRGCRWFDQYVEDMREYYKALREERDSGKK